MKVVINSCFGGFSLSTAAYEKLIEYGVPVRAYKQQENEEEIIPENEGEIIFDSRLSSDTLSELISRLNECPYWDTWTRNAESRSHPLIIKAIEEIGVEAASGRCAQLKIVEIPDGIDFTIEEYDGNEHIAETHRTWR